MFVYLNENHKRKAYGRRAGRAPHSLNLNTNAGDGQFHDLAASTTSEEPHPLFALNKRPNRPQRFTEDQHLLL